MKLIHHLLMGTVFLACVLLFGCSDNSSSIDLEGQWEGEIRNSVTRKSWEAFLYLEQTGNEISGIYWDEWGGKTIRNVTIDDDTMGFVIDISRETVTFFGDIHSDSNLSGTWSYSGDGTNGEWQFEKKGSHHSGNDGGTPPEATPSTGDANPFNGSL